MVVHLNACVHVPEPDPVDCVWRRIDRHLWELCKRRSGTQDVRAIDGESICLSDLWVQVRQRGSKVQTGMRTSRVPLATTHPDYSLRLPKMAFGDLVLYIHRPLVNKTLPPKTQGEERLDRMYWAHNPHEPLDGSVVVYVQGLLAMVRKSFAEEGIHLTHHAAEHIPLTCCTAEGHIHLTHGKVVGRRVQIGVYRV
jgi:hypothetical protein